MCLLIHADGHINVKMLHEQIWPRLENGRLKVVECYDVVFRCHSKKALDRLFVLSPHKIDCLLLGAEYDECKWIFQDGVKRDQSRHGMPTLRFYSFPNAPAMAFDVTELRPQFRLPSWLEDNSDEAAVFRAMRMTLGEVLLDGAQKIECFDPNRSGETTYWLRLVFEPRILHLPAPPIPFDLPGKQGELRVQPCSIICPQQLLYDLEAKLLFAHSQHGYESGAKVLSRRLLAEVFCKPGTGTRVEEHRVSLVTGPGFLVLNTAVEGECGFMDTSPIGANDPLRIARTWFTGSKYYPHTDPLIDL